MIFNEFRKLSTYEGARDARNILKATNIRTIIVKVSKIKKLIKKNLENLTTEDNDLITFTIN